MHQPPPQALRFSHGRGERETSDWWWTARDLVKGIDVFSFPPPFARKFSSKERRLGTRQVMHGLIWLVTMPPPPGIPPEICIFFPFLDVYSPPRARRNWQFPIPELLIDLIYVLFKPLNIDFNFDKLFLANRPLSDKFLRFSLKIRTLEVRSHVACEQFPKQRACSQASKRRPDRFKQFPSPGWTCPGGSPGGMVTGQIEPCMNACHHDQN